MFVPILLVVAFVLLLIFNRPETRLCRWREFLETDDVRWTCVHCGATVSLPRGQRPQTCYRQGRA